MDQPNEKTGTFYICIGNPAIVKRISCLFTVNTPEKLQPQRCRPCEPAGSNNLGPLQVQQAEGMNANPGYCKNYAVLFGAK